MIASEIHVGRWYMGTYNASQRPIRVLSVSRTLDDAYRCQELHWGERIYFLQQFVHAMTEEEVAAWPPILKRPSPSDG